jgi:hypothetical protein
MAGRAVIGVVALLAFTAQTAAAAPGGLITKPTEAASEASPGVAAVAELTPPEVWRAVGIELVKQRVLLAMLELRVAFERDASGTWFLHLMNSRTGCHAERAVGSFGVMSQARARELACEVTSLIESSRCATLPSATSSPPRSAPTLASWVRPAGVVYATTSGLLLLAISQERPPNLSLSFRHAPSAFVSSGFMLGLAGGGATLVVPDHDARPLLELTVASSTALLALAAAQAPERGVPAFGEYAVASGYALTSVLVGIDWALSPHQSLLGAPAWATERDQPRRAVSPYIVYAPAVIGALVSLSRALAPGMGGDDRELTLGLGTYALLPAAGGMALGIVGAQRQVEKERPEPWIAGGPHGSLGLTVGGWL